MSSRSARPTGPFHAKDGWYFLRNEDGSVSIWQGNRGTASVRLDEDTWASAVASVSFAGEHGDTFRLASWLHHAWPHAWALHKSKLEALLAVPAEGERAGRSASDG